VSEPRRPLPVPDEGSGAFWSAAAGHTLALARCARCGTLSHPPDVVCAHCGSTEPGYEFTPVDGSGAIRSWTVIRQSFLPGFDTPFVLVDVELAAQPDVRLIGRLVDGPAAALRLGAPVRLTFEDLAPGISVPAFTLEAAP
jgi:uncharacterized OB-fold protein